LMTTYLPIFSGIFRGVGLGGGVGLEAGTDMTRENSETAWRGYCLCPRRDCDADLTGSGGARGAAQSGKKPYFPK
jgi:hypothetical protein